MSFSACWPPLYWKTHGWQYEESQASKAAHSPALPLQARNSEMNMVLACHWRRPLQLRWLSCKYVTMFLCAMPWEPTEGNESLPWGAIESSRNQEVMSAVESWVWGEGVEEIRWRWDSWRHFGSCCCGMTGAAGDAPGWTLTAPRAWAEEGIATHTGTLLLCYPAAG